MERYVEMRRCQCYGTFPGIVARDTGRYKRGINSTFHLKMTNDEETICQI